jgi:oligopeptide/dipeptide ABC transporter ATP-binding protein
LDEPVSALDVSIRAQVMNLLKDLQGQYNVGYLLIAHNLATVRYMAHQTVVMYLGQVVEYSETEELYKNPLHPYTKALFSAALPSHPDMVREEIVLTRKSPRPSIRPLAAGFIPGAPSPWTDAPSRYRRPRRRRRDTWCRATFTDPSHQPVLRPYRRRGYP